MKRHSKLLVFISVTVFISCNQIPDSISPQDSILIPILITSEVKYVTQYTATCGGVVTLRRRIRWNDLWDLLE